MSSSRIDLNGCKNGSCHTKCNKEARAKLSEDDLCKDVKSVCDSLSVRCVGKWAEKKIYLLYQYLGIFATGMKDKWSEINYIEICSGPGRCINRESGEEIDGTALAVVHHPAFQYLHKAIFFDYNPVVVEVLNKRIEAIGLTSKAIAQRGDYNNPESICTILSQQCSTTRSLNLILIDPTDCSVPFALVKRIKKTLQNVDFIINVATGTDFNRNIPMAFDDKERAAKYETFLGDTTFFHNAINIELYRNRDYSTLRNKFREAYQNSMKSIGHTFFDLNMIEHYYDILFAASHYKALEFWNKAKAIKYDGQRELSFE
ncbi:MAG: three-Cys-motif partner protein TcmP [Mediterranea sp.]|nr:three-Cys-motif partner protein TcmP [Mediterranea sp.]